MYCNSVFDLDNNNSFHSCQCSFTPIYKSSSFILFIIIMINFGVSGDCLVSAVLHVFSAWYIPSPTRVVGVGWYAGWVVCKTAEVGVPAAVGRLAWRRHVVGAWAVGYTGRPPYYTAAAASRP